MICDAAEWNSALARSAGGDAEGHGVRHQHEGRSGEDQRNRQIAALAQVADEDAWLAELAPDGSERLVVTTRLGRHRPLIADAPDVPWGTPGATSLRPKRGYVHRCDVFRRNRCRRPNLGLIMISDHVTIRPDAR